MREFILAVIAGVVATALYKTYVDKPSNASVQQGLSVNPPIGATSLTTLPVFAGQAAEPGHGDAVLNANPTIAYTPAFGAKTNLAVREWVGPYALQGSCSSPQIA
jgi:hypothetical protein